MDQWSRRDFLQSTSRTSVGVTIGMTAVAKSRPAKAARARERLRRRSIAGKRNAGPYLNRGFLKCLTH